MAVSALLILLRKNETNKSSSGVQVESTLRSFQYSEKTAEKQQFWVPKTMHYTTHSDTQLFSEKKIVFGLSSTIEPK